MPKVNIEQGWKDALKEQWDQPYFDGIRGFLVEEKRKGKTTYPPGRLIFNAFDSCPFEQVKVVILGQDPYHGPGQAMGLSFSVPKGIRPPPSLRNIFKELKLDLGIPVPNHGDLSGWSAQGVFLLNAMLTVEKGKAGSHSKIGWQTFTDAVIEKLSQSKEGLVFLLWGKFAQSKIGLIDQLKHYVLQSAHPSPFTGNAFFNNHHFSKTNEILVSQRKTPINWSIED